jgi:hypothetical protein
MNPEQFCYWLQGRLELGEASLSDTEVQIIKDHLKLVFTKVTPGRLLGYPVAPATSEDLIPKPPTIYC